MKETILNELNHYRQMTNEELESVMWPEGRVKHIDFLIDFVQSLPENTNWKTMISSDGKVELYRVVSGHYQDIDCNSEGVFSIFTKSSNSKQEYYNENYNKEELLAYLAGFENGLTS